MSEALIIALVGQVATISVILIQQVFNNKNSKRQIKLDLQKNYYKEKVCAYKKLLAVLTTESIEKTLGISNPFHEIFYRDVLIYASDEVVDMFFEFEDEYNKLVKVGESIGIKAFRKKMRTLGFIAGQIHSIIREEIKEF